MTSSSIAANGDRLRYVIGGPEQGPLVVVIHDWPQTWYTWRNVMPGLVETGFRMVAVDYRGAGASEKPVSGYDKATRIVDIRALVAQELGAGRMHRVGRDIGVMVAYAAQRLRDRDADHARRIALSIVRSISTSASGFSIAFGARLRDNRPIPQGDCARRSVIRKAWNSKWLGDEDYQHLELSA